MSDNRRIIDDALYAHFITFTCHRRRKMLDEDEPKRIVLRELSSSLERSQAICAGFVLMPDHVHAVIQLSKPGQLPRFIHSWKRLSSYRIRRWFEEKRPNYLAALPAGTTDRFWQPKYYSFEIYSQEKLREKIQYMHQNPVRQGLVERAS